jgi:tetratricopeptide (TPR) repeat protein
VIKILIYSLCFLTASLASAQNSKLTSAQWREDLTYLKNEAPKVHKNLYHKTPGKELEKYISDFDSKLSALTEPQIYARFAELVTMFGDGHTVMRMPSASFYPVRLYVFTDGIYCTEADEKYKRAAGKKLLKIDGMDVDEAYSIMSRFIPHDNEWQVKTMMPMYLANAVLLNGAGITKDMKEAVYTFEDNNGKELNLTFGSIEHAQFKYNPYAQPTLSNPPLYLKNMGKYYWFEYLPAFKAVYLKYNEVQPDPKEGIADFIKRLKEVTDNKEVNKFIIDVRNNGGGNNFTSTLFSDFISQDKKINRKGRLFLITGRQTFSAASFFTSNIENTTNAIIAGEPTGASPNHYGDARRITLPNSQLVIQLSTLYWENTFPWDERAATLPEILVESSSHDYFKGKDPVLEAVLNYKYEPEDIYPLSEGELKNITGRYFYSNEQAADVSVENGIPVLKISDGLNISFTGFVNTPLYAEGGNKFKTEIEGLGVLADSEAGKYIILVLGKKKITLEKKDYKLPGELIEAGRFNEAADIYRKMKAAGSNRKSLNENVINSLGYSQLEKKNFEAAIAIFKLNTELYPRSSNVYDSLGEAYMLAGNTELAIINYEESVRLNPANDNGKKMLENLKAGSK